MKKLFVIAMVVGMLASGMTAFAADEAVVDDDMLIVEDVQGDVMPIAETEEEVAAEEAATDETVAEEVTEEVATEVVAFDMAAMEKKFVMVDGNKVEFAEGMGALEEKDSVVFVPARAILEAFGFQVTWSEKEQMVMGANKETGAMIIMQLDNTLLFYMSADGVEGKLEMRGVPYKNEAEWRTYIPVEDVAAALGYRVCYDAGEMVISLGK